MQRCSSDLAVVDGFFILRAILGSDFSSLYLRVRRFERTARRTLTGIWCVLFARPKARVRDGGGARRAGCGGSRRRPVDRRSRYSWVRSGLNAQWGCGPLRAPGRISFLQRSGMEFSPNFVNTAEPRRMTETDTRPLAAANSGWRAGLELRVFLSEAMFFIVTVQAARADGMFGRRVAEVAMPVVWLPGARLGKMRSCGLLCTYCRGSPSRLT